MPGSRRGKSACTGLQCEGLSPGFWNSVKITVPSVIASILIASVNGYGLVNWKFKGSEIFFTILIFGSFIPYQVMLYPLVIITSAPRTSSARCGRSFSSTPSSACRS